MKSYSKSIKMHVEQFWVMFFILQNLISFEYDLERIIDDWVLMGFLVGNDFIPHLPHLHIAHDALPTIWETYKQTLPLMGGYINNKGKIDMRRLETFLVALSEVSGMFYVGPFAFI